MTGSLKGRFLAGIRLTGNGRVLLKQELVESPVGPEGGKEGFLVDRILLVKLLAQALDLFLEGLMGTEGLRETLDFVRIEPLDPFDQFTIGGSSM